MKKLVFILIAILSLSEGIAQNIGIGTTAPDPSAALEIKSSTKGFLTPRMINNSRLNIINPATGLLVYDTDMDAFWYHNDTGWVEIETANNLSGWRVTGSNGTNPASNFIGTTNNQPLRFRLNNEWAGELNPVTNNYSLGPGAGAHVTTGTTNIAIGGNTLDNNSTGNGNTTAGQQAFQYSTAGNNNSAFGSSSLSYFIGSYNTSVGGLDYGGFQGNRNYNTAFGAGAKCEAGSYATAIGAFSRAGCNNCLMLGGSDAGGASAGAAVYTGINNPIPSYTLDIQQINNRGIVLRHPADNNGSNTWEIYHAPSPYPNLPSLEADLVLFYNGAPVGAFNNSSGAYSALSDERMKTNIEPMPQVIEKIKLMKPYTYQYIKGDSAQKPGMGFLAQDIEKIFPQLVHRINTEGKMENCKELLTLDYSGFGVVAIKALQQQQQMIQQQQEQIDALKELIELLEKKN